MRFPQITKLPGVENPERENMAWLEGWISGIFIGSVLGAALLYIVLSGIGKIK